MATATYNTTTNTTAKQATKVVVHAGSTKQSAATASSCSLAQQGVSFARALHLGGPLLLQHAEQQLLEGIWAQSAAASSLHAVRPTRRAFSCMWGHSLSRHAAGPTADTGACAAAAGGAQRHVFQLRLTSSQAELADQVVEQAATLRARGFV